MDRNSLKFRLGASAVFMLLILLPALGFTLNNAFKMHIIAAIEKELVAQSYAILADTEVINGELVLPEQLLDSEFNVIDSGVYALVNQGNQNLWSSPSALNFSDTFIDSQSLKLPELGQRLFYQSQQQDYFISSFSVSFSDDVTEFPLTLHIIKAQKNYLSSLSAFQQQLLTWMLVVAVAFIMIQWLWLKWTLMPFNHLTKALTDIEQGDAEQVKGQYPSEVLPAINQLNHLLKNEQSQRLRYRNALADLAHSLKTPLAIIQSTTTSEQNIAAEVNKINNIVEHQLKRAQSAGQAAWRLSVSIRPCVDKLLAAFEKIYRDKTLTVTVNIAPDLKFRGDEADLLEMLGNLVDNAYKAANTAIKIRAYIEQGYLNIEIADDGKGIAEADKQRILSRGQRADTYQQGHGIGLAIVRDIVVSYRGKITIAGDAQLGGALFGLSFPTDS
ncbi:ATP-binding protein [Colwellia sp. MEBiC06753]